MLACLDRGSRTLLAVQAANRFGVSVLHAGQEPIARAFATKVPVAEKWEGVAWSERAGIPAIDDALVWIACDLRDVIAAGDHVIVTGEVRDLASGEGDPLVFHGGEYRPLALKLATGAVADGLDVVAVGVEDEGAVVAGVVDRARAGCAVVGAAGRQRGGVEGVDGLAVGCGEGELGAADCGTAAGVDPEVGLGAVLALAAEADRALELHHAADPERRQRRFVEGLAARVVADLDPDVVEHDPQPTDGTIGRSPRASKSPAGSRRTCSTGSWPH